MAQRLGGYNYKGANMPIPYEKLTYNDILHHKEAYDCFDRAGKKLFSEWDIVGFEKAVLGCGDNHFLYMAERIKETPNLFGELNATMPFLRFREEGQHYAYELFLSPPPHWGSRGAPLFWAYVAREFTFYKLPMDEEVLYEKYKKIAKSFGLNINNCGSQYIKRFSAGGMSSGVVTEDFVRQGWYTIRHHNRLYKEPHKPIPPLFLDKVKERLFWYANSHTMLNCDISPNIDEWLFSFSLADCKATPHQKEVATTLWGVYSGKPMTIKEAAEFYGLTRERIAQIERRVLQHLLYGDSNPLKSY